MDLAAWTGLAGVVVGVLMTTGIDMWRSRLAERKALRRDLLAAGEDLAAAAEGLARSAKAAGPNKDDPRWIEILDARDDVLRKAMRTVRASGVPELDFAVTRILAAAMHPPESNEPSLRGPGPGQDYFVNLQSAQAHFRDVVLAAKL
jgi:hypothetical protein